MRLALALTVVAAALAVSATPARATPGPATCAWNETAGHPAFRHADGMAIFRRVFDCPGEAKGAYTLRFDAVVGQTRRPQAAQGYHGPDQGLERRGRLGRYVGG